MRVELDVVEEEPFVADKAVDERAAVELWHSLRKSLNNRFNRKMSRNIIKMLFVDEETYYKYTFFPLFAIVVVPFVVLVEQTVFELLVVVLPVVPLVVVPLVVLQAVDQRMLSKLGEYVLRHIPVENYMVDNFAWDSYMDSIKLFQKCFKIYLKLKNEWISMQLEQFPVSMVLVSIVKNQLASPSSDKLIFLPVFSLIFFPF